MADATVKSMPVIVRSGRTTSKFRSDSNELQKHVEKDITRGLANVVFKESDETLALLKQRIERGSMRSIRQIMPFIARSMIGSRQPNVGKQVFTLAATAETRSIRVAQGRQRADAIPGYSLFWEPLSPKTIKKKKQNKDLFFLHKGTLRKFFQANADLLVSGLGRTRVEIKKPVRKIVPGRGKQIVEMGSIRIHLAPNVYASQLPALQSGNWVDFDSDLKFEQKMGISGMTLKKLLGGAGHRKETKRTITYYNLIHRPLMQPVVSFWLLHKLPRLITNTIITTADKQGSGRDRGSSGKGFDL
jgi:hypothetical protein